MSRNKYTTEDFYRFGKEGLKVVEIAAHFGVEPTSMSVAMGNKPERREAYRRGLAEYKAGKPAPVEVAEPPPAPEVPDVAPPARDLVINCLSEGVKTCRQVVKETGLRAETVLDEIRALGGIEIAEIQVGAVRAYHHKDYKPQGHLYLGGNGEILSRPETAKCVPIVPQIVSDSRLAPVLDAVKEEKIVAPEPAKNGNGQPAEKPQNFTTIELSSGGKVYLAFEGNMFLMSEKERSFLNHLIQLAQEFKQ